MRMKSRELKIYLGPYSKVVEFIEEYFPISNREETLFEIRKIEREVGEDLGWWAVGGECRICEYHMLYFVVDGDQDNNLECGNCGNMTIDPKEIYDEYEEADED